MTSDIDHDLDDKDFVECDIILEKMENFDDEANDKNLLIVIVMI